MLSTVIIVFREMLEAGLIVGVVLAASRGAVGRGVAVATGIALGVAGAVLVALFAGEIADALDGFGQEIFNAGVLLAAVVMLAWHNVWMKRHGREIANQMNALGHQVRQGGRSLQALAVVVGLAVLREGSETVLFLYGIAASGAGGWWNMVAGGAIGLAGGAGMAAAIYLGLLRIPPRHLFTVTSALVLVMAAGMASQAAAFLVAADMLPPLGARLWDSSTVVAQDGVLGRALQSLIGYDARPAGVQLAAFMLTLAGIVLLMRLASHAPKRGAHPAE
jgi:high-affinity iron transporter